MLCEQGFEDCMMLSELLDECANDVGKAIERFTARRVTDGHALVDLSLNNYIEARSLLTRCFYTRVTFALLYTLHSTL